MLMRNFMPNLAAAAIGSLPHTEIEKALGLVFSGCPEIPFWPQLPKRDFRENMYVQYSENLPCRVLDETGQKIYFDTARLVDEAEPFYQNYLDGNLDYFALSPEYAAGYFAFSEALRKHGTAGIKALKGHITGPVSFGLAVTDQDKKPLLYDEMFFDIVIKGIAGKAAWQERELKKLAGDKEVIIFIDEPYLTSFGSGFVSLPRGKAVNALKECIDGLSCLAGVHCCGNTDWSLFTEAGFNIISFDAYDFAENVALYSDELGVFLQNGGILAWGIVPTSAAELEKTDADSLLTALRGAVGLLAEKGIDKNILFKQGLVTPNCGAGSLTVPQAEKIFRLTREISLRSREDS